MTNHGRNLAKPFSLISSLSVLAGLILLTLLPIGLFYGLENFLYKTVFVFHLVFFLSVVLVSLVFFLNSLRALGKQGLIPLILFLVFFVFVLVDSAHPIIARDALIYHLNLPKTWIEADQIVETSWNHWSYNPMLINLAFAGFLLFDFEFLSKLYHFSYLILTSGLLLYIVNKKTKDLLLGVYAFLLCLGLPICLKLASIPLVDLALAFYCGLAFVLLLDSDRKSPKFFSLLLLGASLGLAMGVKFNGVLFALLFLSFFLFYFETFPRTLRFALIVSLVSLLVFSPWLYRAYLWTGNPLYPYFKSLLGGHIAETSFGKQNLLLNRLVLYNETPLEIFLIPFRMLFFGQDDQPKYFDAVLSPIILLCLLPILKIRGSTVRKYSYLLVFAYIAVTIFTVVARTRYLLPILVPVLFLTSIGLLELERIFTRWLAYLVLLLHFSYCIFYSYSASVANGSFDYLRTADREGYLTSKVTEYNLAEVVNQNFTAEDKCYLLYTGNRFYYYEVPVRGSYSANNLVLRILKEKNQLREGLKREGVSCVALHKRRTYDAFKEALTEEEYRAWVAFLREEVGLVSNTKHYMLYRIKDV